MTSSRPAFPRRKFNPTLQKETFPFFLVLFAQNPRAFSGWAKCKNRLESDQRSKSLSLSLLQLFLPLGSAASFPNCILFPLDLSLETTFPNCVYCLFKDAECTL